ncbi:MAG: tetratricopeptide repeat protein, partial [Candidatus Binatia bacterium]
MATARLRSFTGAAVFILLGGAAFVQHASVTQLNDRIEDYAERNAVLTANLETAAGTIDQLAGRIGELEEELRLAAEARDWMQYEVARTSGDGRYLWHRGVDLAEEGRYREAKSALETLVRRYPKSPYAPTARERMRQLGDDARRAEIANLIRQAAREGKLQAAEVMLARSRDSLPPDTRQELTALLTREQPQDLRAALEKGMPVGVPHQVYARLARSSDLLEDPKGGGGIPVRISRSKRSELERLRGRSACFTVTMS